MYLEPRAVVSSVESLWRCLLSLFMLSVHWSHVNTKRKIECVAPSGLGFSCFQCLAPRGMMLMTNVMVLCLWPSVYAFGLFKFWFIQYSKYGLCSRFLRLFVYYLYFLVLSSSCILVLCLGGSSCFTLMVCNLCVMFVFASPVSVFSPPSTVCIYCLRSPHCS